MWFNRAMLWICITLILLFFPGFTDSNITDGNIRYKFSYHCSNLWPMSVLRLTLPRLHWKTFILLSDPATERVNRLVASQAIKNGSNARLIILNPEKKENFLKIADLRTLVNVIIACKADAMKIVLKYASEKNFISLYFHWLLLLPEDDETDWEQFLNSLSIPRPENLVVITSIQGEYSIYKTDSIMKAPKMRWNKIDDCQSEDHSYNLCISAPLYRQHLEESIMKLAIIHDPPYTIVQETSIGLEISGIDAEAWQMVALKLKIRYEIIRLADNAYGLLVNNTWNGMMAPFSRNEIDLALPTLTTSVQRADILSISYPASNGIAQFVIRRPTAKIDHNTYILPFSTSVWATFILASALTFISVRVAASRFTYSTGNRSKRMDTSEAFFSIFFAATLQNVINIPKEASLRIILVNFMVLSMLIVSMYSSALVAFLTVESNGLPFSTLQGLVSNNEYRVGHMDILAFAEILAPKHKDPNDIFVQLQKKTRKYKSNFVSSDAEGIEKVYAEKYVYFSWKDSIIFAIGRNCSFILSGFGFQFGRRYYGIPLAKGSPHLEPISKAMAWLKETGNLQYLQKKYLESPGAFCNTKESFHKKLTLVQVIPIFFVLVLGSTLALLVLILEIIWFHLIKH